MQGAWNWELIAVVAGGASALLVGWDAALRKGERSEAMKGVLEIAWPVLFIALMGLLLKFTDFAAVLLIAAVVTAVLAKRHEKKLSLASALATAAFPAALFALALSFVALPAQAGVFLSELCDPLNNYTTDRFIEIYNPTGGTIAKRELQPGQTLLVDTGCVVAYTPSVNFEIQYVGKIKTALFGGEDHAAPALRLVEAPPWTKAEQMAKERENFGFYFAAHPVETRAALAMIIDASDVLRRLLEDGHSRVAGGLPLMS